MFFIWYEKTLKFCFQNEEAELEMLLIDTQDKINPLPFQAEVWNEFQFDWDGGPPLSTTLIVSFPNGITPNVTF